MTNKGFNPLFISALDILLNTLGVFIILNFLNARLAGAPPVPVAPPGKEQKAEQKKPLAEAKPRPAEPRAWWRKPPPDEPVRPQIPPSKTSPAQKPENAGSSSTAENSPQTTQPQIPNTPQDPVAVDLMRQTKGAVVILLQQADQSKASVELMLRQGNQTWKPSRASKYQNSEFQYEKALTYFYQTDIHPGTYEVLVRVKKGQKSAERKPFSLYGKIIPPGQRTLTYAFGNFAVDGSNGDWVPVGTLKIGASDLQYQSRVPAATKTEVTPAAPTATKPVSEPARKPSGKNGKWG